MGKKTAKVWGFSVLLLLLASVASSSPIDEPKREEATMTAYIQLEANALALAAPADNQNAFQLMGSAQCADDTVTIAPGAAQATGTLIGGKQRVVKSGVLVWKSTPKAESAAVGTLKLTLDNDMSYVMELSVPGSGVAASCKMRSSSATLTLHPSNVK